MSEGNPFAASSIVEERIKPGESVKLPVSKIFLAWLCFFLVATFGGFLIGAMLGAILGAIMGMAGMDLNKIVLVCQIAGFAISIPFSFCCYWWSVHQFILKSIEKQAKPIGKLPGNW